MCETCKKVYDTLIIDTDYNEYCIECFNKKINDHVVGLVEIRDVHTSEWEEANHTLAELESDDEIQEMKPDNDYRYFIIMDTRKIFHPETWRVRKCY